MKLDKNLKHILDSRGVSLSKLARATGVPVTTISNWLSGQSPKNIVQLKKVADHFKISIEELVFGTQSINKTSVLDEYVRNEIYAGVYEVVLRRLIK